MLFGVGSFNPLLYTPIGADKNIFLNVKTRLKINIKKSSVTYIFVFGPIGPDRVQRVKQTQQIKNCMPTPNKSLTNLLAKTF